MNYKYQNNIQNFIDKANKLHHNKYDYSKVKYAGYRGYITIVCHKHGKFKQKLCNHLSGQKCKKCFIETLKCKNFVERANKLHHNKYDYSKVKYINMQSKINVICQFHGNFFVTPSNHLQHKSGCKRCWFENKCGKYDRANCKIKAHGFGGLTLKHFKRKPELKNKPSILYFIKFGNECKIGITTEINVAKRFKTLKNFKILKQRKMKLYKAFIKEQNILKRFFIWKIISKNIKQGKTECFKYSKILEKEIIACM